MTASGMPNQRLPFDPNEADIEGVRLWMQAGFEGYFEQGLRRWAFRPLERYVDVRDDLAEDLRAVYQDLDPNAQRRWRTAIRDLLLAQGHDPSKREATRTLIDLAALARVHDVLDVLPTLLDGTDLRLHQVVQTAVSLANRTDAARICLERIYTSAWFSPDYAGLVLVALCHIDPDRWLRHVNNLARPMTVLASRLEDDSTALRFYARSILEAVGLDRVRSENIGQVKGSSASAWLWDEWLVAPDSLLLYDVDSCHSSLTLRPRKCG